MRLGTRQLGHAVGRRNLGQAIRTESSHSTLRCLISVKPVRLGSSGCFRSASQGGPPRIDECTLVRRVSLDCEVRKRGCRGLMGTSQSDHFGRSSIFHRRTRRRGAWHWFERALPKVNVAGQIAAWLENRLCLSSALPSMGGCECIGLRSASGARSERFAQCCKTLDPPGGSGRLGSLRRASAPTDPRRSACSWQSVQESPRSPRNGRWLRFRA
jgi:hypothetical protein